MPEPKKHKCYAKVGEPFKMRECGAPIEYVLAGDWAMGGLVKAIYTGWYHMDLGFLHHAVSGDGWA
jgi:hypothetical protein